jgi:sugar lactone lactonase YvrE
MMAIVYSDTVCALGEGPLWHPVDQALYWFDILGKRLYRKDTEGQVHWDFDEHVSAAGWIDAGVLLIASETCLSQFDTTTGESMFLHPLESDNPGTRSNDGRADPWGGFWIGTMGKAAEPKAGAIYRYVDGTLHKLFDKITIPNAICFTPDQSCAYYADTLTRKVMRVALDANGFPAGKAELFLDLRDDELNPDGAVVDAHGKLWLAQWGAVRVACYTAEGAFERAVEVPGRHASCPAFGGPQMETLFVTTATELMTQPGPQDGQTFMIEVGVKGQTEHQIRL